MRRLQMLEILQWIKSLNIDQDEPVFIAGDFNVEFDSPEYESFLDGLPLEINYRKDDNVGGSFQAKVGSTKPQGPPTRPQRPLTRPQGSPTRPQGPLTRSHGFVATHLGFSLRLQGPLNSQQGPSHRPQWFSFSLRTSLGDKHRLQMFLVRSPKFTDIAPFGAAALLT